MTVERYQFKDFPYSSHRWLLDRVGFCPSRVLEVGTATGFLGRELTRRGHTVVGIEKDPISAGKARAFYHNLLVADLDELPYIPGPRYHFILCGDVLEHTKDPGRVLGHLLEVLEPGGRVLVTVPNVAFVGVRLALLLGSFAYQERGILDRDHLRFFTRRSLQLLLPSVGVRVLRLQGLPPPLPLVWQGFVRLPFRWICSAAAALAHLWPSLWAYQLAAEGEKLP